MKETNLGYHFPGMKKLGYEEPRLLSFFDIADRSPTDFFTDLRIKKDICYLKHITYSGISVLLQSFPDHYDTDLSV